MPPEDNMARVDDDSAVKKTKSYVAGDGRRWAGGEVIYQIDGSIPASCVPVILASMADVMEDTCITFTERTNEPDRWVCSHHFEYT